MKKNSHLAEHNKIPALLGFAERYCTSDGQWVFKFRFLRIFIALLILMVMAYSSLVWTYTLILKYSKQYDLTSSQIALSPVHLLMDPANYTKKLRTDFGDRSVEMGEQYLKEGNFREGLRYLISGISRNPANLRGRIILAQIYMASKPEQSLEILRLGVPFARDNRDYLAFYIWRLNVDQNDKAILDLSLDILNNDKIEDQRLKELLIVSCATAYSKRGQYEKASEFLSKYEMQNNFIGRLLLAENEWQCGNKDEAIELLWQILKIAPEGSNAKKRLYVQLIKYFCQRNEGSDLDKARQLALTSTLEFPEEVNLRLSVIRILILTGENEDAKSSLNDLMSQFDNSFENLLRISNFATEYGYRQEVEKCYEIALDKNFSIAAFSLLRIESMLTAKQYQEALDFVEKLNTQNPQWLAKQRKIFDALRSVVYYATGKIQESERIANSIMLSDQVKAQTVLSIAKRYSKLGAHSTAQRLLTQINEKFPKNQNTLEELIKSEIRTKDASKVNEHLRTLLNMRRPDREILQMAYKELASDRFFFVKDRTDLILKLHDYLKYNNNGNFVGEEFLKDKKLRTPSALSKDENSDI